MTLSARLTHDEWNSVRNRFRGSMMVDTEITKLAQNLDLTWPLKGPEETPLKYVGLTLEELESMPNIAGFFDRSRLLYDILYETMAFDDPFSEMAENVNSSSKHDDGPRRTLEKLGIDISYPIRLCAISKGTKEFCEAEGVVSMEEFLELSQRLAQQVVVGGDFRSFLNTLAHPEPEAISQYMPLRVGHEGLHLAEAIAQTISIFEPAEKQFIFQKFGASIRVENLDDPMPLSNQGGVRVLEKADAHLSELFKYFKDDHRKLADAAAEGTESLVRYFAPLGDPEIEKVALALTRRAFSSAKESDRGTDQKKPGFFARLFGR